MSEDPKWGQRSYGLQFDVISPEDFVFGRDNSLQAKFGAQPLQPDGDWRPYLPSEERQAPGYETNACVSFNTANCIEILARRVFKQNRNFSDRFIAKGSGTNPAVGNSPKKVADFIYRNWTVFEEEWSTRAASTPEEFYTDLPRSLQVLAEIRGQEYDFGYEFVPTSLASLKEALKHSPLGISVPAWFEKDGKYIRPEGMGDNHWCCLITIDGDELVIFDTYSPFRKRGKFLPTVAMRYYLNPKLHTEPWWKSFIRHIRDYFS